jgi:hypothetical protein
MKNKNKINIIIILIIIFLNINISFAKNTCSYELTTEKNYKKESEINKE